MIQFDSKQDSIYVLHNKQNKQKDTTVDALDPVYTRAKVSGFVKISGFLVFRVYGVYTAQPRTAIANT